MKKLLLLLAITLTSCSTYVNYPTRQQNLRDHAKYPKDRVEPYPGQVVTPEILAEFEKNKQRIAKGRKK